MISILCFEDILFFIKDYYAMFKGHYLFFIVLSGLKTSISHQVLFLSFSIIFILLFIYFFFTFYLTILILFMVLIYLHFVRYFFLMMFFSFFLCSFSLNSIFFIKNLITNLTIHTISSFLVCPAAKAIYSFYELVFCRQAFLLCLLNGFRVAFVLSLTIIKNIYLIIIIIYVTLQPHFYLV